MTAISELRTQISTHLLRDPNNRIRPQYMVDSAINTAYINLQQDLFDMIPATEQTTTIVVTAGIFEYTLPSDFKHAQRVWYTSTGNPKALEPINYENIDTSTSWTPEYYYIRNSKIWLYPKPLENGSLSIPYIRYLPTISDTQEALIPTQLDRALIIWAGVILLKSVNKLNEAAVYTNEYQWLISQYTLSLLQNTNLYYK